MLSWLARGTSSWIEASSLIGAVVVVDLFWHIVVTAFYQLGRVEASKVVESSDLSFIHYFLFLPAAMSEEILFRCLPLMGAVSLWGESWRVLLVAAASSVVFGLLHGGPAHLPLQGISSFVYCLLFLKCGGFQGNYLQATASVSAAHYVFDVILLTVILQWLKVQETSYRRGNP